MLTIINEHLRRSEDPVNKYIKKLGLVASNVIQSLYLTPQQYAKSVLASELYTITLNHIDFRYIEVNVLEDNPFVHKNVDFGIQINYQANNFLVYDKTSHIFSMLYKSGLTSLEEVFYRIFTECFKHYGAYTRPRTSHDLKTLTQDLFTDLDKLFSKLLNGYGSTKVSIQRGCDYNFLVNEPSSIFVGIDVQVSNIHKLYYSVEVISNDYYHLRGGRYSGVTVIKNDYYDVTVNSWSSMISTIQRFISVDVANL